jgi:hypothetical protein
LILIARMGWNRINVAMCRFVDTIAAMTADALIARHLRRARIFRRCGVAAGLVLPSLVEYAISGRVQILGFGTDGTSAPYAGPLWAYIGYLAGAVCAEATLVRRVDPARRAASLVPRELADYLAQRLLHAQRALGAVVAAGILLLGIVPYDESTTQPGWLALLSASAFAAVFTIGLEALERWLVRRPQPFTDPALVAADDTVRAESVRSVAGSGLALLLVTLSGIFAGLAASEADLLRATMWLPALVALALSIHVCLGIVRRPWQGRRPVAA